MSGKTFHFYTNDISVFDFFQTLKWKKHEVKERNDKENHTIKFCLIQRISNHSFVEGIIQFKQRITKSKARLYFLLKGITNIQPEGVKKKIGLFLTSMKINEENYQNLEKYEFGKLSLGGGYRDYKQLLEIAFNAFKNIKNNKIEEKRPLNNKIMNSILDNLIKWDKKKKGILNN